MKLLYALLCVVLMGAGIMLAAAWYAATCDEAMEEDDGAERDGREA